jgi:hypothetical protein
MRIGAAAQRGTARGTLRTQSEFLDARGAELALALVPGALEQLALLVLAHLLAALLDHAAHALTPGDVGAACVQLLEAAEE